MKKYIILSLVFAGLVINASASDADSLFNQANANYASGEFNQAVSMYESILDRGMESSEVYYNLGNSYYKVRNYPKAILNYERALLLDPQNENIQHNLEKARLYNVDKVEAIPEFIIKRWGNSLVNILHSNVWAAISLLAFVAGLVLLLIYFLSMHIRLKRIGFYAGILALLIAISSFLLAYQAKSLQEDSAAAIVMTPTITVKGSPSSDGVDLFIIHEGTKVFLLDKLNNWYEVKLSDGKQGWLQTDQVEII